MFISTRDKEKTLTSLQTKVKTLELKWKTSEDTKAEIICKHWTLTKRCQLLEAQVDAQGGEQVQPERAGEVNKSKFNFTRLFDRLWETVCERIVDKKETAAAPLTVEKTVDSKLVQLAARIAQVTKECVTRFKTSKGDSGGTNNTSPAC